MTQAIAETPRLIVVYLIDQSRWFELVPNKIGNSVTLSITANLLETISVPSYVNV